MSGRAWPADVVERAHAVLDPLADPGRAAPMAAYMKGVAPFLGVGAPQRREALRRAWRDLPAPTSDELGRGARQLMAQPEREFHYAAADLLARHPRVPDAYFLDAHVTDLLVTRPWWDTVDALVTAAVSPLCRRYDADWLVDEWSESEDTWLIRAAITHQRGWRSDTCVPRVLGLCDRHWSDREFFVAKAIGWALRDLARIDPDAVAGFLASRRTANRTAQREAERGLRARSTDDA